MASELEGNIKTKTSTRSCYIILLGLKLDRNLWRHLNESLEVLSTSPYLEKHTYTSTLNPYLPTTFTSTECRKWSKTFYGTEGLRICRGDITLFRKKKWSDLFPSMSPLFPYSFWRTLDENSRTLLLLYLKPLIRTCLYVFNKNYYRNFGSVILKQFRLWSVESVSCIKFRWGTDKIQVRRPDDTKFIYLEWLVLSNFGFNFYFKINSPKTLIPILLMRRKS